MIKAILGILICNKNSQRNQNEFKIDAGMKHMYHSSKVLVWFGLFFEILTISLLRCFRLIHDRKKSHFLVSCLISWLVFILFPKSSVKTKTKRKEETNRNHKKTKQNQQQKKNPQINKQHKTWS